MELFPPRPRPQVSWTQLGVTCLVLFVTNLALAIWMAYDLEWRRSAESIAPVALPDPPPQVSIRANHQPVLLHHARSPLSESFRYVAVILVLNALVLGVLVYAVVARYLEALRRYNLGLPTGFDEHRLKRRYFERQSLATGRRLSSSSDSDDLGFDDPPASRFNWPD